MKTTSNGVWDSPIYTDFFTAVRDINSNLPADEQIRAFGGGPGPTDQRHRESAAAAVIEDQVLSKHGKALVILPPQPESSGDFVPIHCDSATANTWE